MRALAQVVVVVASLVPMVVVPAVTSVAAGAPATSVAPEELRHVLFDQVVIADAKRDWGAGDITVEHAPSEQDTRLVMTRAIDPKRLPAATRTWQGRTLQPVRAGFACNAQVTQLRLLAVTEPASELGFWNGAIAPLPAQGAVLTTWNESRVWLVGELSGECQGLAWVRAATTKPPVTAAPSIANAKLQDDVLAAFRTLPRYLAIQARSGATTAWDARDAGPGPVLRFELSGRTLLTHTASARIGTVDEQLLAVWELRDGNRLQLRHVVPTAMLPRAPLGLNLAIDLRGDGRLVFAYATHEGRGALREIGNQLVDVPSLRLATP